MLSFYKTRKSFMLPIAVLPAVGIILALGRGMYLISRLSIKRDGGFDHLPLIFAIGIAIGISKDSNGAAGLSGRYRI